MPTVDEAVEWIMKSITREYRRECLKHWRDLYGSQFADLVEAKVKARWRSS